MLSTPKVDIQHNEWAESVSHKVFVAVHVWAQEAGQLKEALKKEEFRKLLKEYAEEISNPENKQVLLFACVCMFFSCGIIVKYM